MFVSSANFSWSISRFKKNSVRYYYKFTHRFLKKYLLFLSDFTEIWILSKDFQEIQKNATEKI
jgi:hypothetical protein